MRPPESPVAGPGVGYPTTEPPTAPHVAPRPTDGAIEAATQIAIPGPRALRETTNPAPPYITEPPPSEAQS